MTQVEYVNLSCRLDGQARNHIKRAYYTLDERVMLHKNFKLDTDNEAKMANFERITKRIDELWLAFLDSAAQVEHLF
jgi:hypothetical protein